MIKRLDPIVDESLLREAFHWDAKYPVWFKESSTVFGANDLNAFLERVKDSILIGIFDSELVGLLILRQVIPHHFEADLCAKRGTNVNVLAEGAYRVIQDFLRMGMQEGFCFVAEKNLAVRKLCGTIGMSYDGCCVYKGAYKGRVIKWMRYSIKPEARQMEQAA